MRVAELIMAACILVVSGAATASAQLVEPFKILEEARRDRLALDKRLAREAAAQRQRERVDQAAQANAQRKLDKEAAASAPPTGITPSTQLGPSSAREGAPIPTASAANPASGTSASNQPAAPSSENVAGTALPTDSATDTGSRIPPSSEPGAPPAHETVQGAPIPTASSASAANEIPTSNPPVPPLPREVVAGTPVAATARVLITVDKAAQLMRVTVDGKLRHSWPVSTGRAQFETPTGTFRPLRLAKEHYSKEWDDAPMPHSIFFTAGGHAIHGSNDTRRLGRRASHGCVRLAPSKAAALFALVQSEGPSATKVTITNGTLVKTARGAVRARTIEAGARNFGQVRRASPDSSLIGPGDGWLE